MSSSELDSSVPLSIAAIAAASLLLFFNCGHSALMCSCFLYSKQMMVESLLWEFQSAGKSKRLGHVKTHMHVAFSLSQPGKKLNHHQTDGGLENIEDTS